MYNTFNFDIGPNFRFYFYFFQFLVISGFFFVSVVKLIRFQIQFALTEAWKFKFMLKLTDASRGTFIFRERKSRKVRVCFALSGYN